MKRNYQRKQLEFLSRILEREIYFLEYWPDMLISHLYNMIFLDEGKSSQTNHLLEKARELLAGRLWLRLCNRPLINRSMLIRVFEHGDTVWALAWSPDGSLLASAGADGAVRLWEKPMKGLFSVLQAEGGGVNALAWSPNGQFLASGHDDGTIHLWGRETLQEDSIIKNYNRGVLALAWSPDGSLLASAGADGAVRLWEIAVMKQRFILEKHTGIVYALAWSPDGSLLASGGKDTTVRLWDPSTGKQCAILEDQALQKHINEMKLSSSQKISSFFATIFTLAWSDNGHILASGSRANVRIWELATGEPEDEINFAGVGGVASLAWKPGGELLAIGAGGGQIWLWHQILKKRVPFPLGHQNEVHALVWSPNGKLLATGGKDGTVRLWDIKNFWDQAAEKNTVSEGHVGHVANVAWGWDGTIMASGGMDQTGRLWNAITGALVAVVEKLPGPVLGLASYYNGVLLAPLQFKEALVAQWESVKQNPRTIIQMDVGGICSVASSPDEKLVALGDITGNVWVWEVVTKKLVSAFLNSQMESEYDNKKPKVDPVWALAWSPDANLLASSSPRITVIWDLTTKKKRAVMEKHCFEQYGKTGLIDLGLGIDGIGVEKQALAWSPDGKLLASGGSNGTVHIWRGATGIKQAILQKHVDSISALAWSPDGLLLASGDLKGTVYIWNHKLGNCSVVGQCLSQIMALQFSKDGYILRVADDGAVTLNRPIPYIFELCNINAE